jgi:hypothetical protein
MFAKEHRTGTEISLRRPKLLATQKIPFNTGHGTLFVSYSAVAELSCFSVLGWTLPANVLCTYVETGAAINGLDIDGLERKRPSLLEACDLFDIPHMDARHKAQMRELILTKTDYSEEEWLAIEDYNREDVLLDIPLLRGLAPAIDMPIALLRGRYLKVVTAMELRGVSIDADYLRKLQANWQALRMHYIRRDDRFGLYDEAGSFVEQRFAALIDARGWSWPRTTTGKPELRSRTLGKMVRHYPELKPLQRLRDLIAEMRLGAFVNTVGSDGASRCPLMPFWTKSGRNQPQGRDKVFLLSLPSWIHGLIKPPPGWGIAALDWTAQEVAIGAGLSGDPALSEDYRTKDVHIAFAVRAGLAPAEATSESHRVLRDTIKPVSLGVSYGMSKYGAAAATGKSMLWAAEALAAHRHAYPVFRQWQDNTVAQAQFDQRIVSPFGWPMAVHAETSKRTLLNYQHQAGGADCMRLAAIAAHEAGIHLIAPVHDAFWIAAPLAELDETIVIMAQIMVRAGRAVAGIDIRVKTSAVVRWPQCLGDVRDLDAKGQAMWSEIRDLLASGQQQMRTA